MQQVIGKQYTKVVECAIELKDNRFLIIKRPMGVHAGGLLAFPGGKVEVCDEAERYDVLRAAVKREVVEEVSLTLEDQINYITTSCFVDTSGAHVFCSLFHCKIEKTLVNVVASVREAPEWYWMTAAEIIAAPNSPEWLKHYVKLIS